MLSLRTLTAVVATLVFAAAAIAAGPAGRWNGSIALPGQKLEVAVTLAGGDAGAALSGTISIPAQGAKDLPLEKLAVDGAKVTFAIAGVPGQPTFAGELAADGASLKGTFTQGGGSFPFELARAADPADESRRSLEGFDAWLEEARTAWNVPGVAVGIVKSGEVVFLKGSGLRDVDAKLPVTEKTIFAIGSATKAFTTAVLATLVDEGRLAWDTPVRTYLPDFAVSDPALSGRITPRDLVTHRTGLPRHDALWYNAETTRSDIVSRLRYLDLSADLREKFQYNNLAYITAGHLVEEITGATWEDQVRRRILEPLSMTRANFSVGESQKDSDFAKPYQRREGKVLPMPFRDITLAGPAGSVNASAEEMLNWVRLHLSSDGTVAGQRVLSPTSIQELHTPATIMTGGDAESETLPVGYALGWFVDVYRGHKRVHHGGNIDGFSALVTMLPDSDIGMVILVNLNGSPFPGIVARHAADRLLGLEARDWSAKGLARREIADKSEVEGKAKRSTAARTTGTTPSHPLAAYAGQYAHPGYGVLAVRQTGDALELEYNRIVAPLSHWHYDTFMAGATEQDQTFEDQQVLFRTGFSGEIEEVSIIMDPMVKPVTFTRRPDARLSDPKFLERLAGVYTLPQGRAIFSVRGSTLHVSIPPTQEYDLVPSSGTSFLIKGLTGFSVRFSVGDEGPATGATFVQPDGVFEGKRAD